MYEKRQKFIDFFDFLYYYILKGEMKDGQLF